MAKQKLIIFSAGQTAEVAHFYFTNDSEFDVVAFTVDAAYIAEDTLFGVPVVVDGSVGLITEQPTAITQALSHLLILIRLTDESESFQPPEA